MALALTDEHLQLAESVRAWAERQSPPEAVRAAANSPDADADRYRTVLAPSWSAGALAWTGRAATQRPGATIRLPSALPHGHGEKCRRLHGIRDEQVFALTPPLG